MKGADDDWESFSVVPFMTAFGGCPKTTPEPFCAVPFRVALHPKTAIVVC